MTRRRIVAAAVVTLALGATGSGAGAHELTPALLSLAERPDGAVDVLWRVPRDEAPRGLIAPLLPADATVVSSKTVQTDTQAYAERWAIRLPGGIRGAQLRLDGPAGARTDALVRVAFADGGVVHGRLSPGGPPFVVPHNAGRATVLRTYTWLGIQHILLGWDHLLFVFCLSLIAIKGPSKGPFDPPRASTAGQSPSALTRSRTIPSLIKTITAFTVAHSFTLALATLGVLHVPGPPVEATIALSIAFVAREVVRRDPQALTARRPWVVALAFGLLHGLGFASALGAAGLPAGEVPLALCAFNVGVELGQLAFVAAVVGARALLVGAGVRSRAALPVFVGYAIGAVAVGLCLTRVAAFAGS